MGGGWTVSFDGVGVLGAAGNANSGTGKKMSWFEDPPAPEAPELQGGRTVRVTDQHARPKLQTQNCHTLSLSRALLLCLCLYVTISICLSVSLSLSICLWKSVALKKGGLNPNP